ncbi:MAG: nickel-dependent hydrogenase large subunit [Rhodoferax sp.]|nr:nickel-dependent hydrogenase large subunit [Rhodoferax sp.]
MTRLILGPFNRVEGDLEVQLTVQEGRVADARVNAPMYRGFERMLTGHAPLDALTIVPRICGICSVSQTVAAALALRQACNAQPPANGVLATDLMLGCENLADHLTHFYLFFMPDFTRQVYRGRAWFERAQQRFGALVGSTPGNGLHNRAAVAARVRWFELVGTLGGKWPHTGAILPGGSARALEASERVRLLVRVREMRAFLEGTLFGGPLEEVAALTDLAALQRWCQQYPESDLTLLLELAADTGLATLGAGPNRYLSYGAYPDAHGVPAWLQGVWDAGTQQRLPLTTQDITEDSHHAWYRDTSSESARHPMNGLTEPDADKPDAYSWNKAPRLAGCVVQTGALARQLVDGHALIHDAVAQHGGTVLPRVLARLLEIARILPQMEQWLHAIELHAPFFQPHELPAQAQGVGLVEAARGALGHWLRIDDGRLSHYQIIAPTSWNFSPRDAQGIPGALEAALVGAPMDLPTAGNAAANDSVAVQHIVRSFDPCMVCTVH